MDALLPLDVLSRWLHVGTAIVLVGGSVFMRFLLMPSATVLPDANHQSLREGVLARWKRFVHLGVALLLLTGLYNYVVKIVRTDDLAPAYHMLMGIKILLALAVFVLAIGLVGRSPAFESLRQNRPAWLLVTILLAAVVVAIGGYLKVAVVN